MTTYEEFVNRVGQEATPARATIARIAREIRELEESGAKLEVTAEYAYWVHRVEYAGAIVDLQTGEVFWEDGRVQP